VHRLTPAPLTGEAFAPFGDVIGATGMQADDMNAARFERYDRLAQVDTDGGAVISIVTSRTATALPYEFDFVERHPRGSQAFIPLHAFRFVVVVAAPGETVRPGELQAFVTDGRQGISYHRGTWHMPLIALQPRQSFLVVDRAPGDGNLDEMRFAEPLILEAPDD
jgi:ureidoglycolate lyase